MTTLTERERDKDALVAFGWLQHWCNQAGVAPLQFTEMWNRSFADKLHQADQAGALRVVSAVENAAINPKVKSPPFPDTIGKIVREVKMDLITAARSASLVEAERGNEEHLEREVIKELLKPAIKPVCDKSYVKGGIVYDCICGECF